MELIKNKRVLALVGIIGLILGIMLPYYTVTFFGYSTSVSLWGYLEGKIIFLLTLAFALIIFKDVVEKYVPQLFNNVVGRIVEKIENPKFALIPTALVAGYAIYLITQLDVASDYISYGLGFYVLWIGILALIGHAIFYKKEKSMSTQPAQPIQSVQPTQPIQQTQQPQVDPSKKYCPNCRTQLDANADACFMCGTRF